MIRKIQSDSLNLFQSANYFPKYALIAAIVGTVAGLIILTWGSMGIFGQNAHLISSVSTGGCLTIVSFTSLIFIIKKYLNAHKKEPEIFLEESMREVEDRKHKNRLANLKKNK